MEYNEDGSDFHALGVELLEVVDGWEGGGERRRSEFVVVVCLCVCVCVFVCLCVCAFVCVCACVLKAALLAGNSCLLDFFY